MFFSINLLEILPLYLVNIFFFLIFSAVLAVSFPIGKYLSGNLFENSLIKTSIFSVVIFAALVSSITNLVPIISKYIVFIFYLLNFLLIIVSLKIRKDFFKAIHSFKYKFLLIFLIFLIVNQIFKFIFIDGNNLTYLFSSHDSYFLDPIIEILTADYFSRLKIFSLYPYEWSTYHFFESSFSSFFLSPVYQSGTIGLIVLKNFYLSIFLILFFFSFLNIKNYKKERFLYNFLKIFLILLVFIFLFYPKVVYFILTKNFVSTISIIFLVQSLLSKNRNDLMIWLIILSMAAFRNIFISLMLFLYYLLDTQNIGFKNILTRIKKILILPNIILTILFLFYFLSTVLGGENVAPIFHLLNNTYEWWNITVTDNLIDNYKYFIITIIALLIFHSIIFKNFFISKLISILKFNKKDFYYLLLLFLIPIFCTSLLVFEDLIISRFAGKNSKTFFQSFNISNLYYYFFVPIIWFFILFPFEALIRFIFLSTVIIYTLLSIFISNNIILPAFFSLEVIILFFVSLKIFEFSNLKTKKYLSSLFMVGVIIASFFNLNLYYSHFHENRTGEKITFKILDIKKISKKKFICPSDIKTISSNEFAGAALSGVLAKPYYSDISLANKYYIWNNVPSRFANSPKKTVNNPCNLE